MPSFAKKPVIVDSNPLAGLWKDHPNTSPMDDLITDSRIRAAEILKSVIPSKIIHLRSLISSETDPKSILYVGHLETGDYAVPRMVQPDHIPLLIERSILDSGKGLNPEDIRLGEKIVSPDDVVVAKGRVKSVPGVLTPESEKSQDTLVEDHVKFMDRVDGLNKVEEKGVTSGPHWFEVVPRNKIQTDLIHLLCKEHEELHRLTTDLKLWLELEIPLIEDGNSFGAEVQNHLIRELDSAFKRSNGFHNGLRQHHTDRIKLVTEWVRYPNVLDYPAAIANSDRFDHFLARSYLRQMLTIYGGLMTKFQRNWDKVINPKGNGGATTGGMY